MLKITRVVAVALLTYSLIFQPITALAVEGESTAVVVDDVSQANLIAAESAEPPRQVIEPQQPVEVKPSEVTASKTAVPEVVAAPTAAPVALTESKPVTPLSTVSTSRPLPPSIGYGDVTMNPQANNLPSDIYISALQIDRNQGIKYIDIYNGSEDITSLEGWQLKLEYSSALTDYECHVNLYGYILSRNFINFSDTLSAESYLMDHCLRTSEPLEYFQMSLVNKSLTVQQVRIGSHAFSLNTASLADDQPVRSLLWNSRPSLGLTVLKKDSAAFIDNSSTLKHRGALGQLYEPYEAPLGLKILELLPNPAPCARGDEDFRCDKYIKLANVSSAEIDLSLLRLRSGERASPSSSYNTSHLSGVLKPGEFRTVNARLSGDPSDTALKINSGSGATWLEDAYGLRVYGNDDTPYEKADTVSRIGQSWALDETTGQWGWAMPSPDQRANEFISEVDEPVVAKDERVPCSQNQYRSEETGRCRNITSQEDARKPCRDDQYRSEETGRCRSLTSSTNPLKPCKEGQYRAEETGRCRSISSAVNALKPCAEDQFRNPVTGRCKKIASAEDIVKPCQLGFERNPATNRCRKIRAASMPAAEFAVAPIAATSAQSLAGWWALGGVLLLAAGYGAWEWRREMRHLLHKVGSLFASSGK